jgi:hypothetical protein
MAVKIPPQIIIALVVVVIMVLVIGGFLNQTLFSGPEFKATSDIAEMLDQVCDSGAPFTTTFNVYLPDSKQGIDHNQFFYIAVDDYKLMLVAKEEARDILTSIVDYLSQRPGERTLKKIDLKICKQKEIQICGAFEDGNQLCDKFQFESNEGKESLTFVIKHEQDPQDRVILSYTRLTMCGDGHCCGDENNDTCAIDCKDSKPCTTY